MRLGVSAFGALLALSRLGAECFTQCTRPTPTRRPAALLVTLREAETGFVDEDENLEEGETLVVALRAYASRSSPAHAAAARPGSTGGTCFVGEGEPHFLCAGALVRRGRSLTGAPDFRAWRTPGPAGAVAVVASPLSDDPDSGCGLQGELPPARGMEPLSGEVVLDAWLGDSAGVAGVGPNSQFEGALALVDALFLKHLRLERAALLLHQRRQGRNRRKRGRRGVVQVGDPAKDEPPPYARMVVRAGAEPTTLASRRAALARGFRPAAGPANTGADFSAPRQAAAARVCLTLDESDESGGESDDDELHLDFGAGCAAYTAAAWAAALREDAKAEQTAREILALLAARRAPLLFRPPPPPHLGGRSSPPRGSPEPRSGGPGGRVAEMAAVEPGGLGAVRGTAARLQGLLPVAAAARAARLVWALGRLGGEGGLSGEADSVDGLPSKHAALVAGGRPVGGREAPRDEGGQEDVDWADGVSIRAELLRLLGPWLTGSLLPAARDLFEADADTDADAEAEARGKSSSPRDLALVITDVSVRAYGPPGAFKDDPPAGQGLLLGEGGRTSLPAHHDVFAAATAVVELGPGPSSQGGPDPPRDLSASGRDGSGAGGDRSMIPGPGGVGSGLYLCLAGCAHAGGRRFPALAPGDAIFHTWDVMHGVDCEPERRRQCPDGFDGLSAPGNAPAACPPGVTPRNAATLRTRTSLVVWFATVDTEDAAAAGGGKERPRRSLESEQVDGLRASPYGPADPAFLRRLPPWLEAGAASSGRASGRASGRSDGVTDLVAGSATEALAAVLAVEEGDEEGEVGASSDAPRGAAAWAASQAASSQAVARYLRAAKEGNPHALARLGSLAEAGALGPAARRKARQALSRFPAPPPGSGRGLLGDPLEQAATAFRERTAAAAASAEAASCASRAADPSAWPPGGVSQVGDLALARALWLAGALRGSSSAQAALGDAFTEAAAGAFTRAAAETEGGDAAFYAEFLMELASVWYALALAT